MATHNLEHLRTFLAVYRAGSLTEAARLLGISQPTASTHVHSLEQNLGLRLFERAASGVKPTPKADGLARDVGPHIDALDDLAYIATLPGANEAIDLGGSLTRGASNLGDPVRVCRRSRTCTLPSRTMDGPTIWITDHLNERKAFQFHDWVWVQQLKTRVPTDVVQFLAVHPVHVRFIYTQYRVLIQRSLPRC